MKHIVTAHDQEVAGENEPIVLAIGAFDGIHIGHREVIKVAREMAAVYRAFSGVYTFRPHPSIVLGYPKPMILSLTQKREQLERLGVDYYIEQCFDERYSQISEDEFLIFLRRKFRRLLGIAVGEDFRFGANRGGDARYLRELAGQTDIAIIPSVVASGTRVSSSSIRRYLSAGHMNRSNEMLGYAYYTSGEIVHGRGIASRFGFPTMNVYSDHMPLLRFGAYIVAYRLGDDSELNYGVANFGVRPTFFEGIAKPMLEVHGIDPSGKVAAGGAIEVQFLSFLRPEKHFQTQVALCNQVRNDIKVAKRKMSNFVWSDGNIVRP